jgi:hypothetical protein
MLPFFFYHCRSNNSRTKKPKPKPIPAPRLSTLCRVRARRALALFIPRRLGPALTVPKQTSLLDDDQTATLRFVENVQAAAGKDICPPRASRECCLGFRRNAAQAQAQAQQPVGIVVGCSSIRMEFSFPCQDACSSPWTHAITRRSRVPHYSETRPAGQSVRVSVCVLSYVRMHACSVVDADDLMG